MLDLNAFFKAIDLSVLRGSSNELIGLFICLVKLALADVTREMKYSQLFWSTSVLNSIYDGPLNEAKLEDIQYSGR